MAASVRVPSYRRHKPTDQAVVTLGGRDIYLGKHGSAASHEKYRRMVAEYLIGAAPTARRDAPLTCGELMRRYRQHADGYYRKAGKLTSEALAIRSAIRFVVDTYGSTPAAEFDVLALRTVRERIIDAGHCRSVVNQNVGRIVRAMRWAVTQRLYPGLLLAELEALPGLRRGRTRAPERPPVEPVADDVVEATLPHLSTTIADMVRLQRVAGMRPGEVCLIRPMDIDRAGEVWVYVPESHKTEHHGRSRSILIGPRGQGVLRPYLLRPEDEYCFRSDRFTPTPRKLKRYRRDVLTNAIRRACRKASPMPEGLSEREAEAWARRHWWSPNQLRHSFGTEVRRLHGLEAAQVLLGHATADVTQVYAERDLARGRDVAARIG